MRTKAHWIVWPLVLTAMGPWASAQNQTTDVQQLQDKVGRLESQVQELLQSRDETDESFDEMDSRFMELSGNLDRAKPGKRSFLLTGLGASGFGVGEGATSSFSTVFNPIFLWKINDRTFVEGELEFELEGNDTAVNLEFAQYSYILNDYMTLSMGKFLNPNNVFIERLHPSWINRLPDKPMAFGSNKIQSLSHIGAQLRGGVPVGSTKMNYAVFAANGPSLRTDDPALFGSLSGEGNFEDGNTSKAIGGRVGWFLLPKMEVGYSLEYDSNVTPDGSGVADASATIQSVDFNYTGEVANGTLDARVQWAFSNTQDVTFDPGGGLGFGPTTLNNNRDGGYFQLAFRPSDSPNETLSKFEGVVRYDAINLPAGAPESPDVSHITLGVDFWSAPNSVFKLAWEIESRDGPDPNSDALLFQWGVGF